MTAEEAEEAAFWEGHERETTERRADLAEEASNLRNAIRRLHGELGTLLEQQQRLCAGCDTHTLDSTDEQDLVAHLEQAARSMNAVRALMRPNAGAA